MAFILSADYLASPESPLLSGRSELEESRQREVNYVMPDADVLARHHFALMDDALMHQLLPCYGGNPLAFFKAFLGDEIPEIKQAIRDQLELLPQDIELILSWSNCPSLEAVAAERGIPVAYLEVGPLREPQYRSTAYFDFSGVNGNTEAEARYQTGNGLQDADFNLAELRRAFAMQLDDGIHKGDHVGVVLQVEDDSNLVCFNNGYDNIGLIAKALLEAPEDRLLIRSHPGSRFEIKSDSTVRDASPTVVEFLKSCKKVSCINSSVGLEALMLGIPVEIQGDASYKFVSDETDPIRRRHKLAFYLFAYLVPFDLVFSAPYIRFRLQRPSESEIVTRHIEGYGFGTAKGAPANMGVRHAVARMGEMSSEGKEAAVAKSAVPSSEHGVSKLYYRVGNEDYTEEFSLAAINSPEDGGGLCVRFVLPAGQRPDFVRFNPPPFSGCHVLSALRWEWLDENAHLELAPLFDMSVRIVTTSGFRYSDGASILLLAEDSSASFELSVNDLWSSVPASTEEGEGVLEFSFSRRSMQAEMVYTISCLRELVSRTEEASAEKAKHLDTRFSRFEQAQIDLAESVAREGHRLQALVAQLEGLRQAQDTLAFDQGRQAENLGEMVARLNEMCQTQSRLVDAQGQGAGYLQEAIRVLDEIRRISLMGWWQKREARRTKKSKS